MYYLKKISFHFFLLFCIVFSNYAQTYIYDHYGVENGLLQSKVTSIIQDKEGYIWFATEAGASKFDGINFQNYTAEEGLGESNVSSLFLDKTGNIWFGHVNGRISKYNTNGSITQIDFSKIETTNKIITFFEDKSGLIWAGTMGAGVISILNDSVIAQYAEKDDLGNHITSITQDIEGNLWFATAGFGVKIFRNGKFESFKADGYANSLIYSILIDKKEIWLGTYNRGVIQYNLENKKITNYRSGLKVDWITSMIKDYSGTLWVGTWGGGIAYLPTPKESETLQTGQTSIESNSFSTFSVREGISDNKIWCLLEDREQNLWIGTNEGGVSYYKGKQFSTLSIEHGLVTEQVNAITQDKNLKYWIGTNQGISIYDQKTKAVKSFDKNNLLKQYRIEAITPDYEGNMWIGTWGGGVYRYNMNSGSIRQYSTDQYIDNNVSAVLCDRDGNIWIGSTRGVFVFNKQSNSFKNYQDINGLSGNNVTDIYQDSNKGRIWIGVKEGNGITVYEKGTFNILGIKDGLRHKSPVVITEDQNNNIWIGTEGGGLYKYDDKKFINIKKRDGLLSNLIKSIVVDDKNNIWVGTNFGLSCYDQENKKFKNYGKAEGFLGIEAKSGAAYKDQNGDLWFGSTKGVTKFNTSFHKKQAKPVVHLKRMMVNLKERPLVPYLELSHDEDNIQFFYTGIYFSNPEGLRYSYILEGLKNAAWSQPDNKSYVTFPVLPYGEYCLKVKAITNQGVESEKTASYSFIINPPFYLTKWFIISSILFLILSTYLYIKWRTRKLQADKKLLEKKVAERTSELKKEKEKVEEQHAIIAEKNKDITDSILYAQKIQASILPSEREISTVFNEYFILYKPRDIVSGDFYWFTKYNNKAYIAAVDCTGHGVPGAFMSMIGFSQLNQIVSEAHIQMPSEILNILNIGVKHALKQSGGEGEQTSKDGMELALICYDKEKNIIEYSGANRPLYLFRNNELQEIKADKIPIGGSDIEGTFTNHEIQIQKGDTLYIFSDGYPDQFGGENGKKFMTKRFKEKLSEILSFPMQEQKEKLNQVFEDWRGRLEQVDDVMVIGIRF